MMQKDVTQQKLQGIVVCANLVETQEKTKEKAEVLAKKLKIALLQEQSQANSEGLFLQLDEEGLWLSGNGQRFQGDFTKMLPRIQPGRLNGELLVKASRLKGFTGVPRAIDATAGLGEDAFLLAAAGFLVRLYERDLVIAALLADAMERGKNQPETAAIVERMELISADSCIDLAKTETSADVILLDPMFPTRQKSGLIKKKFQLLQQLECPCTEEEQLLTAALAGKPRKIVIKRPLKGPYLAGRKPDYSLKGKAIRYDCIVLPPM